VFPDYLSLSQACSTGGRHLLRIAFVVWPCLALTAFGARAEGIGSPEHYLSMLRGTLLSRLEPEVTVAWLMENQDYRVPVAYGDYRYSSEMLVPLIGRLADGNPEDRVAAKMIEARTLWQLLEDTSAAEAALRQALDIAAAAGLTDRQMAAVLVDLALLAGLAGKTAEAEALLARGKVCVKSCSGNILIARAEEFAALMAELTPEQRMLETEDWINAHAADPAPIVATMYSSEAYILLKTRPMTAADYALRAWAIHPTAHIGESAVLALLRANRYDDVVQLSAPVFEACGTDTECRLEILRIEARARVHLRDPSAAAVYDRLADLYISAVAGRDPSAGATALDRILFQALTNLLETGASAQVERLADLAIAIPDDDLALQAWTVKARLLHLAGNSLEAANFMPLLRDWPVDEDTRQALIVQEAAYARAAGADVRARVLLSMVPEAVYDLPPPDFSINVDNPFESNAWSEFEADETAFALRNAGNYEGAAWLMAKSMPYAAFHQDPTVYQHAQWLWQVAYTLARGGQSDAALPIMSKAAEIASALSFASAGEGSGGSLQLLERDAARYLLFVDIAWAMARGAPVDSMLVLADY